MMNKELENICNWLNNRLSLNHKYEELSNIKIKDLPKLDSLAFISFIMQLEIATKTSFSLDEILAIRELTLTQVLSKYKNVSNY